METMKRSGYGRVAAHARSALFIVWLTCCLLAQSHCLATVGDDRFAMSGWKGWDKFDQVGSCWWLNWGRSLSATYVNDNYPYLRMYWRTKAGEYTDAQIQSWASTVRALYGPGVTVWWTASNEPNDRGQANQTPAEFAAGYYQYHRNLKIGDPTCKVLGPGILNWTFLSTSVWQKGKDWYEELRQVWASDPVYSAYSMSIQGNPYPPMDGFNLHTYDLRGVQGTPYVGPPDWKYLRDETLACYADLQTYPETRNLKIWNTEYGSLRAGNITDSADTLGGIGLWFRQQPFMARWFFFILTTGDGSWQQTVLLDSSNNVNSLGKAHLALSTLGNEDVYNLPFNADYTSGSAYEREGSVFTTNLSESYSLGLNIYPQQGFSYAAGQMRGRTYAAPRRVKRVTFNYRMTCDPAFYQAELDIPGQTAIWTSGQNTGDQWADLDLTGYVTESLSLGLYCTANNTYTGATGASKLQVCNITFYLYPPCPTPTVTDDGLYTTNTTSLHATWTINPQGKTIEEFKYAVGTTPGSSNVVSWTSAGLATEAVIPAELTPGHTYFISVKARDSDYVWSDAGVSDGIKVVSVIGFTPARTVPDGVLAMARGIVTAGTDKLSGLFYVQSEDRSCAIKAYPASGVIAGTGDLVDVIGTTTTSNGERALSGAQVTVVSRGNPMPEPLEMTTLALGGGPFSSYVLGTAGGIGLNNNGLLVRVFGKVQSSSSTYCNINEGLQSGGTTVRIDWSLTRESISPPAIGSYVMVTGISSLGRNRSRMIRPRSQSDVILLP